MANSNAPFGFVPVRTLGGGNFFPVNRYAIASGYGTQIGCGDPVKIVGDADAYGYAKINVAGTTDLILGIFAGCQYQPANGDSPVFSKNWPASTAPLTGTPIKAFVYDDPTTIFKVQATGSLATTDLPNNCTLSIGTIVNGVSGATVGSFAATNTLGWKALRLWDSPDNSLGTYGIVEVMINKSQFADQVAIGT